MFSIIIPVYNIQKHIDKCLQSVLGQKCEDIEIIIVNDGSTDNSADIIENYRLKDNRIKVITQENSGLRLATHEYIMFIDGDDFIDENTCEKLAEYIKKDKSDVYIFGLYYDYGRKQDIGSQNLKYKKYNNGKDYMEFALKDGSFRTFAPSKIFKNDLLGGETFDSGKKIRFLNGLLYEDMLFVTQVLCKAKSVTVVPEYFYHYVQHQSGRITMQYRKKDIDVLTFVDTLANDYYQTGEITKYIYAVLFLNGYLPV